MLYRSLALFAALASFVRADMVPTSPDGSTVARIGSDLTALWDKDTTGQWNNVTIQLMSGDNLQMVPVTTLETGVDATTLDQYQFTVPEVTPTSKIYFLQFTPNTGNRTQVTWTTRFTIAGTDGSITPPSEQTQPDGQNIPWGIGTLVGATTGATGATGGANSTMSSSVSSSVSAIASSVSASASSMVASASMSMASLTAAAASEVESATAMSTVVAPSAATSARASSASQANASASPSTSAPANAAGQLQVTGMGLIGAVAGLVAYLA